MTHRTLEFIYNIFIVLFVLVFGLFDYFEFGLKTVNIILMFGFEFVPLLLETRNIVVKFIDLFV